MKTLTVCNELHKTDSVKYSDYFILLFEKVFHFAIISSSLFLCFFLVFLNLQVESCFHSAINSNIHFFTYFARYAPRTQVNTWKCMPYCRRIYSLWQWCCTSIFKWHIGLPHTTINLHTLSPFLRSVDIRLCF